MTIGIDARTTYGLLVCLMLCAGCQAESTVEPWDVLPQGPDTGPDDVTDTVVNGETDVDAEAEDVVERRDADPADRWRQISGYHHSSIAFEFDGRIYLKSEDDRAPLPTLVTFTSDGETWKSIDEDPLAERLSGLRGVSFARFEGHLFAHSSDNTAENPADVLRTPAGGGQLEPVDWTERNNLEEIASVGGELFVIEGRTLWRRSTMDGPWEDVTPSGLGDSQFFTIETLAGRLYAKVTAEDRTWVSDDGGRNWSSVSTANETNFTDPARWAVRGNNVYSLDTEPVGADGSETDSSQTLRVSEGTGQWQHMTIDTPVPMVRGSLAVKDGSLFALGKHSQLLSIQPDQQKARVVHSRRLGRRHAESPPLLVADDHFVTAIDRITLAKSESDEHWSVAPGREGRPDDLLASSGRLWVEGDIVRMARGRTGEWVYPAPRTANSNAVIERVWETASGTHATTKSACILRFGRGDPAFHFADQWVQNSVPSNGCQTDGPVQEIGAFAAAGGKTYWLGYLSTIDAPDQQGLARTDNTGDSPGSFEWIDFNLGDPQERPTIEDIVEFEETAWVFADTSIEGYRELFSIRDGSWRRRRPPVLDREGQDLGVSSIRGLWRSSTELYAKVSTGAIELPNHRIARWRPSDQTFRILPAPPDEPTAHTVDHKLGPVVATTEGIARFDESSREWRDAVGSLPNDATVAKFVAAEPGRVYVALNTGGIWTTTFESE